MDKYSCFADLNAHEKREEDYRLVICPRPTAQVAIIAPHGGRIEPETSKIAEMIAGNDFSFYSFEGFKQAGNRALHITSHRFDEPECLGLVAKHRWVLAIHGCAGAGEKIILGGLDRLLISDLESELRKAGMPAEMANSLYAGEQPLNICNRGSRKAGVQCELSLPFRRGEKVRPFVEVVGHVLLSRQSSES